MHDALKTPSHGVELTPHLSATSATTIRLRFTGDNSTRFPVLAIPPPRKAGPRAQPSKLRRIGYTPQVRHTHKHESTRNGTAGSALS